MRRQGTKDEKQVTFNPLIEENPFMEAADMEECEEPREKKMVVMNKVNEHYFFIRTRCTVTQLMGIFFLFESNRDSGIKYFYHFSISGFNPIVQAQVLTSFLHEYVKKTLTDHGGDVNPEEFYKNISWSISTTAKCLPYQDKILALPLKHIKAIEYKHPAGMYDTGVFFTEPYIFHPQYSNNALNVTIDKAFVFTRTGLDRIYEERPGISNIYVVTSQYEELASGKKLTQLWAECLIRDKEFYQFMSLISKNGLHGLEGYEYPAATIFLDEFSICVMTKIRGFFEPDPTNKRVQRLNIYKDTEKELRTIVKLCLVNLIRDDLDILDDSEGEDDEALL